MQLPQAEPLRFLATNDRLDDAGGQRCQPRHPTKRSCGPSLRGLGQIFQAGILAELDLLLPAVDLGRWLSTNVWLASRSGCGVGGLQGRPYAYMMRVIGMAREAMTNERRVLRQTGPPSTTWFFPDWEASITRQAAILDRLIRREWGPEVTSVLDVSCGIGTQVVGLAQLGYDVTASDLAPEAIERARREAATRGLHINFSVADMRQAREHHRREFDVLISCDNSVPHLLNDRQIRDAFCSFYHCIRPGGGCLITVRDYDWEDQSAVKVIPYGVRQANGRKYFAFQVWEYEGSQYDLSMYLVEDQGGEEGITHIFRTRYYAISTQRLEELLREAGFRDVHRAESEYYQPVIVGSK